MTISPGDIYITAHVHKDQAATQVVVDTVAGPIVWAIHLDADGNRGLPVEPMTVRDFLRDYKPRPKLGPPKCTSCDAIDPYATAAFVCRTCRVRAEKWSAPEPEVETPPETEPMPPAGRVTYTFGAAQSQAAMDAFAKSLQAIIDASAAMAAGVKP